MNRKRHARELTTEPESECAEAEEDDGMKKSELEKEKKQR